MHYELLPIAAIAYIVAVDFAFRRVLFTKRAQLAYSDPMSLEPLPHQR